MIHEVNREYPCGKILEMWMRNRFARLFLYNKLSRNKKIYLLPRKSMGRITDQDHNVSQ